MGLSPHSGSRDRSDPYVAIKAYALVFPAVLYAAEGWDSGEQ